MPASMPRATFQYRKRYEVTCDFNDGGIIWIDYVEFQYRKRYEVTCDKKKERA